MIRVRGIKVNVKEDSLFSLKKKISRKIKSNIEDILEIKIIKKSIDARKNNEIYYVYDVDIKGTNEEKILKKNSSPEIFKSELIKYELKECGKKILEHPPIIVGSGPAGLFAAYFLALKGYKPIVLERGECVENRIKTVEQFWNTGKLNPESNVSFGEGGAGTFSDGKLNTMIKDKNFRGKKVLEIFTECGAEEKILYESHPHIGTNKLTGIVKVMREKIISMGGTFLFQTKLTNLKIENGKIKKIEINHSNWIDTNILILAIGHSARDTFSLLLEKGLNLEAKPFAVGVRVLHQAKMIQESQYKECSKYLPPASYKLTYTTKKGRGVYSFCMCPGGYVVNASSEENHLVINGMSESKRDTETSNAAIVVTITKEDLPDGPLGGLEFQKELEKKAYENSNGLIPTQLYKDFLKNTKSNQLGKVKAITKGKIAFANLKEILPLFIAEAIEEAMPEFGKKIKGFDSEDTILMAIESRTSSPIRILRDEHLESNIKGIYPCGEGAGYAGGITSSGVDGIKCAEEIISIYKPFEK